MDSLKDRSEPFFKKDRDGNYWLYWQKRIMYYGSEVAIAYHRFTDESDVTLLKYGSKEHVSSYVDKHQKQYSSFSAGLTMISTSEWDVDELNKIISISDYINRWLKKQNIIDIRPKTRVVHCKVEPYDVLIDRTTIYGNWFIIGQHGTREEVIEKHMLFLGGEIPGPNGEKPPTIDQILYLKGKTIGCWCKPKPCHGDNYVNILEDT